MLNGSPLRNRSRFTQNAANCVFIWMTDKKNVNIGGAGSFSHIGRKWLLGVLFNMLIKISHCM